MKVFDILFNQQNKVFGLEKGFVKIENKQLYKTTLGEDNDEVIVGDTKAVNFKPQVTFNKWNGENYLTIKVPDGLINSFIHTITANRLEIKDAKTGFYFNKANSENFKFGLILYEKPQTNSWQFQLEGWEEFYFFYQPPLANLNSDGSTWEEGTQDAPVRYRPAEIVGSYAIYHKTKRNYIEGGVNYHTGKFGHFYCPKFIDANGNWIWGKLHIENGIYTITVSQDFLDTAIYPIRANDVFGNQNIQATRLNLDSNQAVVFKATMGADGDVSKLTIRVDSQTGDENMKGLIYDDDGTDGGPGTRKGITNAATPDTTASWDDFTFASAVSLTAGDYWIGCISSAYYIDIFYDTGATGYLMRKDTQSYGSPITPWDDAGDNHYTDYIMSIYATYTTGATPDNYNLVSRIIALKQSLSNIINQITIRRYGFKNL